MIAEVTHMPRTRRTAWQEPERKGPPELDTEETRKRLGYKNVQSVHQLANRGPQNDGLQAYIYEKQPEDGLYRWVPKTKPSYPGQMERFYLADVEEWDRRHPFRAAPAPASYSEEERKFVLSVARTMQDQDTGIVQRTKLMKRLAELQGKHTWNARTYTKLKDILNDAGIPGGIQHDPSPRRQRKTSNGY